MLYAANPASSLWHNIVPPQLIYAHHRCVGVVLQPPGETAERIIAYESPL